MNTEFFNALDLLEKEKGISKQYMLEKVEAALMSAFKKELGGNTNVRILLDENKKEMKVYQQKAVVEVVENPDVEISLEDAKEISKRHKLGGVVEFELKPKNFRRLSAQAAKQVIIQGIREAERSNIAREYESKKEEIITAIVDKVDDINGNLIIDTGTSRATLLKSEQIPGDSFNVGDRLKVFVTEVKGNESRGPIVTLSRIHPKMVQRLFELEIPEIQDGTVIIKSVSRDAGSRTKIAVYSRDENVDPVGACIGNKGMRIGAILNELGNEKIDVIRYDEDPAKFVAAALAPANIVSVELDGERTCRVTVTPDQLSLAIGKEGQNAKLAAKLTGFKIDIKA
ncbi:MAG: transcription termination/antitermination protein NusA [Ruminococcaceae bacterium]|nr:transcription termination/antitermination protein NusA [Oscillospiraceae bacterium]